MDSAAESNSGGSQTSDNNLPSLSRKAATLWLIGISFIPVVLLTGIVFVLFYVAIKVPLLWSGIISFISAPVVGVVGRIFAFLRKGVQPGPLNSILRRALSSISPRWQSANRPAVVVALLIVAALSIWPSFKLLHVIFDPYTGRGRLILTDPLDSNNHQHRWRQTPGICDFLPEGGYQAVSNQLNWGHFCSADNTNLSNFVYEVQMHITSGDCGGLTFEAVKGTPAHAYAFFVCQDGHFSLERFDHGESYDNFGEGNRRGDNLDESVNPLPNGFIPIAIEASSNEIVLYLNGNQVKTVPENMYHGGAIGVIANDVTQETIVVYKDVKVWQL